MFNCAGVPIQNGF